jgi:flagellar protein FliT
VSVVQALYEKTKALHDLVSQGLPSSDDERDAYIENLNKLLEDRQTLIGELSGSYSAGDMAIGQRLVALNQQLEPILEQQLKVIEVDIGNFKRKKAGRNKYTNPYQRVSNDGMFLDKKK